MTKISSFSIQSSKIIAAGETRNYIIKGDVGAQFMLQVVQTSSSDQKFFNFKTNTFETNFSSSNNLSVTMLSRSYSSNIVFPAGVGKTYHILLMSQPNSDTDILRKNRKTKNIKIEQEANVTLSISLASDNTNNYESFPSAQEFTGTPGVPLLLSSKWESAIANKANDTDNQANGLRLTSSFGATLPALNYYYTIQKTVDGAITSGNIITLDDVDNLGLNTQVWGVSSGSLTGQPSITKVSGNQITLSTAQTFADGITLTFRAYGFKAIYHATGLLAEFNDKNTYVKGTTLTTTVRGAVSGTTVNVNGSRGISGGSFVTFTGAGVDNSTTNNINTVSLSSTAGSFTCDVSQTLTAGTVLTLDGCNAALTAQQDVTVKKLPNSSINVYLDLDKFITPGISGS